MPIVRIVLEPLLDWQIWRMRIGVGADLVIAGRESYPQLVWLPVREQLLETDSGPLDAKVP